jgi:hypothetical protein
MFDLIEFLKYTVPSLIIGGIAIYFLKAFFEEERAKRNYELKVSSMKQTTPIRFQAYERLALLLERISMVSLVRRIPLSIESLELYKNVLIKQINDEFDHNLSQQIYVTPELWNMISTAKNATIVAVNQTYQKLEEGEGIMEYKSILISGDSTDDNPTKLALLQLKLEVYKEF